MGEANRLALLAVALTLVLVLAVGRLGRVRG
jgi:hypothetical protein